MARPDGRIEKGQRLASAISARAWNRAQEAADRVLGAGTGVEAGTGPVASSVLRSTSYLRQLNPLRHTRFGMIVDCAHSNLPANYGAFAQKPPLDPGSHYCQLYRVVPFVDRRQTASSRFSVLAGGAMLPAQNGSDGFVEIITHGTCLAMVRKNPGGFLPRVRPAVIRYSTDTEANLKGIAEDADCGWGELLYWTNIKPFSTQRQNDEGIQSPESLDDTLNNVFYAVVRI